MTFEELRKAIRYKNKRASYRLTVDGEKVNEFGTPLSECNDYNWLSKYNECIVIGLSTLFDVFEVEMTNK